MQTTQKKTMQKLQQLATDRGLELVVDEAYANTGSVLFMKEFKTLAEMRYDFQSTNATFRIYPNGSGGRQAEPRQHYVVYSKEQDWLMLFNYLTSLLPEATPVPATK